MADEGSGGMASSRLNYRHTPTDKGSGHISNLEVMAKRKKHSGAGKFKFHYNIGEKQRIKSRSEADGSETLTRACSGSSVLSCLQVVQPTSTVGSCVSVSALSLCFYLSVHLSISMERHMRQLRLVALHVESSAEESESFGLMLCGVSVSQERPSGSGPEEVGSRRCFCPFCGGGVGGLKVWVFHPHLCLVFNFFICKNDMPFGL